MRTSSPYLGCPTLLITSCSGPWHPQIAQREPFMLSQRGLDLGHIHLRLDGQVLIDVVVGLASVLLEQTGDASLARVVSRERQPPVAEPSVKLAEITGRGASALFRVQP